MKRSFGAQAAAIAAATVLIDQCAKFAARLMLAPCTEPPVSACDQIRLFGPLRLVRLENAGTAAGFFQGMPIWVLLALAGIALVPVYARRFGRPTLAGTLAIGLQLGGALGNLADRALFGAVTDFIDVGAGFAFNPADVALVAGMVLAMRALLTSPAPSSGALAVLRQATLTPTR
jgi:signal peptidase II